MPYFGEPIGRVKMQTTSKNSQRYYTTKRLIRDLLSNTPNWYVLARISWIFIYRECVIKVCEAERNWRGKSSQLIGQWQETCLTGPLGRVVRHPVNVNPGLIVNCSIIFSCLKMLFTSNIWCSLRLVQLKTVGQAT